MAIDKRNPVDRKEFTEMMQTVGGASVPAATTTTRGTVLQGATQADSVAADVPTLVTDFNALLAKLRTAGIIAT